ncbi:NADPH:quinone reductase, partial [Micromonospora aurantiaca]|nr:NADPH:quinone reductase [Micromonospora aurantiaca]
MRAVWLREFGGPEVLVLGTAPDPSPGPGQVLVDVAHANITFVETMFRASGFGPFGAELPVIPGNGVGGTITALGPDVDPALAGRVVVTATGGTGAYAERVVVDQGAPVAVPPGLALDAAVALMADGRTALMLARAAGLRPGDRVLVEAA